MDNIRVYIENENIGFSIMDGGYEPAESNKVVYKCSSIKKIEEHKELFYHIEFANTHLKVGKLQFLGKKEKLHIVVFFPKERGFLFKGNLPNFYANIIYAGKNPPKNINYLEIVNTHNDYLKKKIS